MSDNFKFPTDTCVLVCSGPSLNLVDPFALGVPVVAISTAIRVIKNPHYWVLADYLNEMHGPEGNIAYQNENVVKILPTAKINPKHKNIIRNYNEILYADSDRGIGDINAHLFSGNLPMLKGPHKSVTFAIQWLHHVGVKNVIWVGNDLNAKSANEKYAYESTSTDLRKSHNYNSTLDQVHQSLKNWYPKAKQLGYTWYSWKCGQIFEQIVSVFDEHSYQYPQNSIYYEQSKNSEHPIVEVSVQKVVQTRLTKEERRNLRNFRKENVLSVEEEKKINRERVKQQQQQKIEEIKSKTASKQQTVINTTPKTPVSTKKYANYVTIPKTQDSIDRAVKKIKDSLR